MSSIAHGAGRLRARAHGRALRWLVGAILVASAAVVLALAVPGADGDRPAPAAPSPHASPFHGQEAAPGEQAGGTTPCCGHRP
jgi:hypothetical protein